MVDSREAARAVETQKLEGVILDVLMHNLDGFELTELIRKSKANPRVPIVMLTGLDDVHTMRRAFKAISNRDALARKAGAVVGVFDASNMTERECAAYVLKKVGISAAKGHEVTAANAYLAGVNKARPAKSVSTMDSADRKPAAAPSFLSKQLGA